MSLTRVINGVSRDLHEPFRRPSARRHQSTHHRQATVCKSSFCQSHISAIKQALSKSPQLEHWTTPILRPFGWMYLLELKLSPLKNELFTLLPPSPIQTLQLTDEAPLTSPRGWILNSYRKKLVPDQEEQRYHPQSSHVHSWIWLPCLQKPKQILYNKKGNEVFFLRGMNYVLTGPIIVACQWNTESQKDRTIRDFSELSHNQKKVSSDKALWGAYSHLQQAQQSSGLAGLAAGHSAPIRNTQIFERHPHEKKHHSAAPLQTWESKQILLNRPVALSKKSTLEISVDTEMHFLPDRSAAKDSIVL